MPSHFIPGFEEPPSPNPYAAWSGTSTGRLVDASNEFGRQLVDQVRRHVLERVTADQRPFAAGIAYNTLYAIIALIEGIPDHRIDDEHRLTFSLHAHVRNDHVETGPVESFELGPGGEGLCMGLAGWVQGDFGDRSTPQERAAAAAKASEAQRARLAAQVEKDAVLTSHRCPHCGQPCPAYRKTCRYCKRIIRE